MLEKGPILLVEDDQHDAQTIISALREVKVPNEVIVFSRAREAHDYLLKTADKPLIILCDLRLPEMDGLRFRRMISENEQLEKKSIPFVFFTGVVTQSLVDKAYKMDIQGFFEKPANYQDLKDCLLVMMLYWRRSYHPTPPEKVVEVK